MSPAPKVQLEQGVCRGAASGGGVSFHGIPYAAAPTGELRFAPPQPPPPWPGELDCTSPASLTACPDGQLESRRALFLQLAMRVQGAGAWRRWLAGRATARLHPVPSEDCLRLSLHAPAAALAGGGGEGLPVAVWIDSGGLHHLPAGLFAPPRGHLLVHLRHRTGPLGWFCHPGLGPAEESGNQGLADLVQGLHWVRQNIAAFGGDPQRVVLCGHGLGADSLLQLMVCPQARGLFCAAMAHSPTPVLDLWLAGHGLGLLPSATEAATAFAAVVLREMEVTAASEAEELQKLREAPAELLSALCWGRSSLHAHVDLWGCAAAGAWGLPRPALHGFREGTQAQVPLLIGYGAEDGALSWDLAQTAMPHWRWGAARNYAAPVLLREEFGEECERFHRLYPMLEHGSIPANRELRTDAIYAARAAMFAAAHAAAGAQAHLYRMDGGPGGSFYSAALPLLTGGGLPWVVRPPGPGAEGVRACMDAFVEGGGAVELPAWRPHSAGDPAQMQIDAGRAAEDWACADSPHRHDRFALLGRVSERRLQEAVALLGAKGGAPGKEGGGKGGAQAQKGARDGDSSATSAAPA